MQRFSKNIVAIIAGDGNITSILAKRIKEREDKVIGISIGNEDRIKNYVDVYHKKRIFDIKKIINILVKEGAGRVVLIGRVDKKLLLKKGVKDKEFIEFLESLKDKSTTSIMSKINELLMEKNIEVIPQTYYLSDFIRHEGVLTENFPGPKLEADINYGFEIAKNAVNADIAQAVTVKNKMLISVEDISGTDALIERSYVLSGGEFVLAKVAKDNQDYRFDLPVVGKRTIELLIQYKAKALVIEKKKTIFVELKEAKELANKHGLIIISK
jgi:DUF1009 family protein